MIEPRLSFHMLHKRDSSERSSFYSLLSPSDYNSSSADDSPLPVLEHDEPEIPVHPALEYEIIEATKAVIAAFSDSDDHSASESATGPREGDDGAGGGTRIAGTIDPTSTPTNRSSPCDGVVLLGFLGLVVFGSLNAVTLKLQAIPMFNYPNFLNLFCNVMYIPICFAYIIPAACCSVKKHNGNHVAPPPEESDDEDTSFEQQDYNHNQQHTQIDNENSQESVLLLRTTTMRQEETQYNNNDRRLSEGRTCGGGDGSVVETAELPTISISSQSSVSRSFTATADSESEAAEQQQSPHETLGFRDLAIMGFLDSLATTMQIYAAVYLPGPLLILLPQAAVPLSLLVSLQRRQPSRYHWTQYVGAIVVVVGILVLMAPHWTNQLSASYYCEAIDVDNDCTICKLEFEEEACLSHYSSKDDDTNGNSVGAASVARVLQSSKGMSTDTTPDGSLCQWLPFEEATREEEVLASVWSTVLIASCIPMIISTLYKEWAMERNEAVLRTDYPIYLNGWIALFQLFFSVPLAFLGALVTSPAIVEPLHVIQNLWSGLQCYLLGSASITHGCHPDSLCGTYSFWLVNLHLVASLGYSYFMLFCLKYGTTSLFFLAVTLMVPLGTAAFLLPFMPLAGTPCISDFAGSIAIVIGLVLYRFFDTKKQNVDGSTSSANDDEEDQFTSICRASFPWQRRPVDDTEPADTARTPLLSGDV
ncbi:hypothetical protein ACA910_007699 [Epithemia clementina (nom. ined.)]